MLHRLVIAIALLVLLASVETGCMGRMALSSGVSEFNVNVTSDQWGREIVFVAMHIIPVYPTCAFFDLFVFNSIEFWKGTNPINGKAALTLSSAEQGAGVEAPGEAVATPSSSVNHRAGDAATPGEEAHVAAVSR